MVNHAPFNTEKYLEMKKRDEMGMTLAHLKAIP